MKRRAFLKAALGIGSAICLPGCNVRTDDYLGVDMGAPDDDHSAIAVMENDEIQEIIDLGRVLDGQDVPPNDRWMLMYEEDYAALQKIIDDEIIRLIEDDGYLIPNKMLFGRIDGFRFIESQPLFGRSIVSRPDVLRAQSLQNTEYRTFLNELNKVKRRV